MNSPAFFRQIAPLVLIVTSCHTQDVVYKSEVFSDIQTLHLRDAIELEKKLGSTDMTPKHLITISDGIYPNTKRFELSTPQTFMRSEEKHYTAQVEYFYSTEDSLVRCILYSWRQHLPKGGQDFMASRTEEALNSRYMAFDEKFSSLQTGLASRLGVPSEVEIDSTKNDGEGFRDGYKWTNGTGPSAYLFMLGNNQYGNREIRLAVYSL